MDAIVLYSFIYVFFLTCNGKLTVVFGCKTFFNKLRSNLPSVINSVRILLVKLIISLVVLDIRTVFILAGKQRIISVVVKEKYLPFLGKFPILIILYVYSIPVADKLLIEGFTDISNI